MKRTIRALLALTLTTGLAGTLLTPASAAAPEELRLGELTRGAPPAVPYVQDGVLVDGTLRLDLPKRFGRYLGMQGDDYLLWVYAKVDGPDRIVRLSPDGSRELVLEGGPMYDATLSDDGNTMASSVTSKRRLTAVKVYDLTTGRLTHKRTLTGYASVLDFDGARVAVGVDNPWKTVMWTLATDSVTKVVGRSAGRADLSLDRLATITKDPYLGGCTVVTTFSDPGTELWRSCRERVEGWSTDGSRMITVDLLSDGIGPGRVWLRKTGGRMLGRYDAPYYFGATEFEDATHLLMDTFGRTKGAIVRCDGASCERATRITPHNPPQRADRAPLERTLGLR